LYLYLITTTPARAEAFGVGDPGKVPPFPMPLPPAFLIGADTFESPGPSPSPPAE